MFRTAMVALAAAVFLYLAASAVLFLFQRSLLFVADKTDVAPADLGLDAEVHRLMTTDHVTITSWLARNAGPRIAIYFHGNGGSLAYRGDGIRALAQLGLSVLAVEYRGYGGSEGSPSEEGLARDADAAYDFARRLGFAPSRILLYGESLGSGVAVSLATRREVAGLILDSPFTSIADVAVDRYWMFPVRYLIRDPFHSDRRIADVKVPIIILHGTDDNVVPIRFGRRLFALAGQNATFVEVEGAGHIVLDQDAAQAKLRAWLLQLPPD